MRSPSTVRSVRIARGHWLPEHAADDLAARCAIALSTRSSDTVVCGLTAAQLHGMWLPRITDEIHLASTQPDRAAREMSRSHRPEFIAHRRSVRKADCTIVNGLPMLSPARVWIDLGAQLDFADLVAAGDSVLRRGTTVAELTEAIGVSRRVRGVRAAREALPLLDARSESRPESHLRVAVSQLAVPWDVNVDVRRWDGSWLARPDLSLAEARIALEYQGSDHATVDRMRKDITRETDLRRAGWRCLYYGPAEVFGRPWQIWPELQALIRDRAPQLLTNTR